MKKKFSVTKEIMKLPWFASMKINLKLKNNLKNKHQKIVSSSFATFQISLNYVIYTRVKHSLLASLQETFVMWHLHDSGIFKSDQDSWQIGSSY